MFGLFTATYVFFPFWFPPVEVASQSAFQKKDRQKPPPLVVFPGLNAAFFAPVILLWASASCSFIKGSFARSGFLALNIRNFVIVVMPEIVSMAFVFLLISTFLFSLSYLFLSSASAFFFAASAVFFSSAAVLAFSAATFSASFAFVRSARFLIDFIAASTPKSLEASTLCR